METGYGGQERWGKLSDPNQGIPFQHAVFLSPVVRVEVRNGSMTRDHCAV